MKRAALIVRLLVCLCTAVYFEGNALGYNSTQTTYTCKKNQTKDSLKIEQLLRIAPSTYKTLKDRRKFYKKAHQLFTRYGYEIRWLGVAEKTVRLLEFAHSKFGGLFAHTNAEIRLFFNEGNKAILDDMLPKVIELWREGIVLKDTAALNWDAQMLSDEQHLIDPFYEQLSTKSQSILDQNLKRWTSEHVLGNPSFKGAVLDQEARWEFGMVKMGYCVAETAMPPPENDWKKCRLKIQSISPKGRIIVSK